MNSLSFEEAIDHELFGQLKEQCETRGIDTRLYAAVYYFSRGDGFLTASDLINEVANDNSVSQIADSSLVRDELIAKLLPDAGVEMDSYVRDKITTGLHLLNAKINSAFYTNYSDLFPSTPAEEVEETIPEVDVSVDAQAVQEET